jgi:hypothetical protein
MFKTGKPPRSMIYVTPYVKTRFYAEDATRFVPVEGLACEFAAQL